METAPRSRVKIPIITLFSVTMLLAVALTAQGAGEAAGEAAKTVGASRSAVVRPRDG